MSDQNKSTWSPTLLIILNLLAACLLISWLLPTTRVWWDVVDFSIFNFFNNSLKSGKGWQTFWAITNWRLFDIIQFILVFGIAFYWVFERDKQFAKQRIMEFFYFVLLCYFINLIFHIALLLLDYRRLSPTKIIDGAFRLSKTVTWLMIKDSSNTSFPGDHGFVLICASAFFWMKGGFRLGLVSSVLFAPFLFPRLIVGAHWATDILVGSIFMSLIAISWYFGTSIQSKLPLWSTKKCFTLYNKEILNEKFN
jgi:membrane-associated phospholipid phosphatase